MAGTQRGGKLIGLVGADDVGADDVGTNSIGADDVGTNGAAQGSRVETGLIGGLSVGLAGGMEDSF